MKCFPGILYVGLITLFNQQTAKVNRYVDWAKNKVILKKIQSNKKKDFDLLD